MSVSTGIIELFLRPPIGLMKLEVIPGEPFSGAGNFQRSRFVVPLGTVGVDAFGISYSLIDIPSGYGQTNVPNNIQLDRVAVQLAVQHTMSDGATFRSDQAEFRTTAAHLLFSESFPERVFWELAPGLTARFWWLVRPLA